MSEDTSSKVTRTSTSNGGNVPHSQPIATFNIPVVPVPVPMVVSGLHGAQRVGRAKPRHWSLHEDNLLRQAVQRIWERDWKIIAECVPGRNHVQCLQRWKKALDPKLVKGPWSDAVRMFAATSVTHSKLIHSVFLGRRFAQPPCEKAW